MKFKGTLPGNWHFFDSKSFLTEENLSKFKPIYIFFPHWSWKIPKQIYKNYKCIIFHMTELPFGRGGSPLQNLIIRGYKKTKITAIDVVETLDAGDIYCQTSLSLNGRAQEIYENMSEKIYQLIKKIIKGNFKKKKQKGKPIFFKRRTALQSKLPQNISINEIHDHIRMLDAEEYPNSYIEYGDLKISFSKANYFDNKVTVTAEIKKKDYV